MSARYFLERHMLDDNGKLDTSVHWKENFGPNGLTYFEANIYNCENAHYDKLDLRSALQSLLGSKGIHLDSGLDTRRVNWNIHCAHPQGNLVVIVRDDIYYALKEGVTLEEGRKLAVREKEAKKKAAREINPIAGELTR